MAQAEQTWVPAVLRRDGLPVQRQSAVQLRQHSRPLLDYWTVAVFVTF